MNFNSNTQIASFLKKDDYGNKLVRYVSGEFAYIDNNKNIIPLGKKRTEAFCYWFRTKK